MPAELGGGVTNSVGRPQQGQGCVLVGRAQECAVLDALLRDARGGRSGALVLSGPVGVGKSALLTRAADGAADLRTLRVSGVESELAFGFAGVHQLVLPLVLAIPSLPEPQRLALETVLGRGHHEPPEPYLVGLAVLTLLADAAAQRPVLVVVDDAQWLDDESLTVLSFVARRLHGDRVALVVGLGTPANVPVGFEDAQHLELQGLPPADARELLTSHDEREVAPDVADRLVIATGGNPLALIELPAVLSADQLRGTVPLPEPLPMGPGLAQLFEPWLRMLDDAARDLLLLTSAERVGDVRLLRRASVLTSMEWAKAVDAVETSGLALFVPNVEFRHPLVRSAVYYAATPSERRAAHAALGGALDAEDQLDRRAWHLAAAAAEPDERIALELEAAADRLRLRGGVSAAVAYLSRAAELAGDPSRAADRLLEAARAELTAGRGARAKSLLDRAGATGLNHEQSANAAWTAALMQLLAGDVREAGELLARTLPDVSGDDPELALGVCVAADAIALAGSHLLEPLTRAAIVEGTRRLCGATRMPAPMPMLVTGTASQLSTGERDATPLLRAAVTEATTLGMDLERAAGHHVHVVYFDAVLAAVGMLDDQSWDELTRAWEELSRRTGVLVALPLALGLRSWLEVLQGRPGSAASHLAEAGDLASFAGVHGLLGTPPAAQVLADAWHGDEDATRAGARRMMQQGHERGQGIAVDQAYAALTLLELSCGRYDAALRTAQRCVSHDTMGLGTLALADLIESATRCRQQDLAEDALARLSERAGALGTSWARGLLLRSQALLATVDEAGDLFNEAITELARTTLAPEQARTNLMYGEWLRRARRRRDARQPLRDALEVFQAIGAEQFASRTAAELAATGEQVRKWAADATAALTPQEAQIARLAASGARNAEIAAQLYITTSTVEYHLRKVFVKLGVTSRTQLAQASLAS